ncbi:MAG: nucleoside monophosphate kinase [Candidatus Saccharimonadales bacterium]
MTNSTTIDTITQWLGSGSINLFGLPFAGKDTQAELLVSSLGGVRLSGGEILRNSNIPPHVKAAMDAGDLAPTQEYINIVLPYLSRKDFKGKPLILSSVGRWHGEENGVLQATEKSGHPTKAVIFLTIDENTLRYRWKIAQDSGDRGERADDAEHILDNRLSEFIDKTLPVIDHYRNLGLLIEIDASGDVQSVYEQILLALENRASGSAYGASGFGN